MGWRHGESHRELIDIHSDQPFLFPAQITFGGEFSNQ